MNLETVFSGKFELGDKVKKLLEFITLDVIEDEVIVFTLIVSKVLLLPFSPPIIEKLIYY